MAPMKYSRLIALAAFLAGSPSQAAHWGGVSSGGHGWSGGGGGSWSGGRAGGVARSGSIPSSHAMTFAHDGTFTRGIAERQRVEVVRNHYYFHNDGGRRYWHFFDRGGLHWYGFYFGPAFYWFPFYAGYWWWYDANATRWAYYWDGYWWWNGPGGAPYVYVNNNFVPYDEYSQRLPVSRLPARRLPRTRLKRLPRRRPRLRRRRRTPPPPTLPPRKAARGRAPMKGAWRRSPEPDGEVLLFDESKSPPLFMKYLGKNGEKVRFSGGSVRRPLRILVELKDGGFSMFDADGKPGGKHRGSGAADALSLLRRRLDRARGVNHDAVFKGFRRLDEEDFSEDVRAPRGEVCVREDRFGSRRRRSVDEMEGDRSRSAGPNWSRRSSTSPFADL